MGTKNDTGGKTVVSKQLKTLRENIIGLIDTEKENDPKLRGRFPDLPTLKQPRLDKLLSPSITYNKRNGDTWLNIYFECDAAVGDEAALFDDVSYCAIQYNRELAHSFKDPETRLEVKGDVLKTLERIFITAAYAGNKRIDLFTVNYAYNLDGGGTLKIGINERLARTTPDIPLSLFSSLWEGIILNHFRIEGLEGSIFGYGQDIPENTASDKRQIPSHSDSHNEHLDDLIDENEAAQLCDDFGLKVCRGNESFKNIGGYENLKEEIKREALYPLLYPEIYNEIEKNMNGNESSSTSNAILFYGKPGTGKTLMGKAIASEQKINFIYLPLQKMFSKWLGEAVERLSAAYDAAEAYSERHGKTILFIDEIDALSSRSEGNQAGDVDNARLITTLLTKLEGFDTKKPSNLIVIGATNYPGLIDPALRSRFGYEIEFPLPTTEDRIKITALYAPYLSENDLKIIANSTDQFSGRDLRDLKSMAVKRLGKERVEKTSAYSVPPLTYFLEAIKKLEPKIRQQKQKVLGYS
jgi:SpoVK/Ycf46/Vps4 family AAA+-type ATPase